MSALLAIITVFLTPLPQHGFLLVLRKYLGNDWDVAETALFFDGFTVLILFGVLINMFNSYGRMRSGSDFWQTRITKRVNPR